MLCSLQGCIQLILTLVTCMHALKRMGSPNCAMVPEVLKKGVGCAEPRQGDAGDNVGHDGLRAEADQDAGHAAQREQRRDVDAQHVQAAQAAAQHDQPGRQPAQRQQHPLQRIHLAQRPPPYRQPLRWRLYSLDLSHFVPTSLHACSVLLAHCAIAIRCDQASISRACESISGTAVCGSLFHLSPEVGSDYGQGVQHSLIGLGQDLVARARLNGLVRLAVIHEQLHKPLLQPQHCPGAACMHATKLHIYSD